MTPFIVIAGYSWQCKSESGFDCHFPFLIAGEYSYECKTFGNDDKLQCAIDYTLIDGEKIGVSTSHNPCDATCPGGKNRILFPFARDKNIYLIV